jgi:class 3 adenylate cyclase
MKTKILVVDDEADLQLLIRQRFRRKIREEIYEFVFAGNGEEALAVLAAHPDIDVVLADINMPVMDGLTLLTRLRDVNPVVKTVMVSAYGDMANIRTAMNRGAFDFVCKPVDFNDLELTIEKTIAQVNELRAALHMMEENKVLRLYVDETVLKFMARPEFSNRLLASETIQATVVFIDICGFTMLAEKMPAQEVVAMLNTYFDQMVKEIIAQGGYVDKFVGDAVMAVFRGDYHLDRAIDAALAVRSLVQTIPPALPESLNYEPAVSIGISSGEMVSGNIGSATLRRLDYTVIGDVVNMGQRLQDAAHRHQILITDALYTRVQESFRCRAVGEVRLKNKAEPVLLYEVLE